MADKYVVIAGDKVVERIDALNYLHAAELQTTDGDLYIACGSGVVSKEAVEDFIARGGNL